MLDLFVPESGFCCDGGVDVGFDLFSFLASWLPVPLRSLTSWLDLFVFLVDGPSFLPLLLPFEELVELEDEWPLLRLGPVEVVTTVSREDELPKRRDS